MLRKLLGYAAVMGSATVVFGLLSLAVSLLGMVTLSKDAYGEYMTYVLVYASAQGFFIFGANAAIQKFSAATPENRARFASVSLRLFLALFVVTGLAAPVAAQLFNIQIALGLVAIPWVVTWWWGRYLVRATLDAKGEATIAGVVSLSTTGLQLLLLTLTPWENALVYGDLAANVLGGIVAIFLFRRATGAGFMDIWRARFPKGEGKEAFKFAIPFWWAGQIGSASTYASGFLIRLRLGSTEMATNGAAQTFWQFAFKPIELLSQATLPGLVGEQERRKELLFDLMKLCLVAFPAFGIAVAGGMPALFWMIDFGSQLFRPEIQVPFSEKYAGALPLLIVLAAGMPLTAFWMVIAQYATAVGEARVPFASQTSSTVVSLAVLFPLTSWLGLMGPILTGHLGAIAGIIAYVVMLRHKYPDEIRVGVRWLLVSLLWCTGALALIWFTKDEVWGWASVAPALLLYAAGAFALGLLRVADLQRAWRSRRKAS